ncbi:hypothetical protein [Bacillus thuringiensis]|nr:hypothetical protein [Bacillus thuringiensis]
MKKVTIKLLGFITALTLALGIYSPTDKNQSPQLAKMMTHGDYGG